MLISEIKFKNVGFVHILFVLMCVGVGVCCYCFFCHALAVRWVGVMKMAPAAAFVAVSALPFFCFALHQNWAQGTPLVFYGYGLCFSASATSGVHVFMDLVLASGCRTCTLAKIQQMLCGYKNNIIFVWIQRNNQCTIRQANFFESEMCNQHVITFVVNHFLPEPWNHQLWHRHCASSNPHKHGNSMAIAWQ